MHSCLPAASCPLVPPEKSINIVTEEEFRRLLSDFQICPQLLQPMDVTTVSLRSVHGGALVAPHDAALPFSCLL